LYSEKGKKYIKNERNIIREMEEMHRREKIYAYKISGG
jgi:hypothetical protein